MGGRADDRYQADAQKEERVARRDAKSAAIKPLSSEKNPGPNQPSSTAVRPCEFLPRIPPIASASSSGSEGLAPWIVGAENLDRSWR